ncbi:MAG: hypothetical protein ABIT05_06300 [Chitinophagaceae bacterium]
MRKRLLLILFWSLSLTPISHSQNSPDSTHSNVDSSALSRQVQDDFSRNTDYIIRLQQERRARQKRDAFLRIGFGAALLLVLIIGLRRKGKKRG